MAKPVQTDSPTNAAAMRLDKWLWVARWFKTRSLASAAVEAGRVRVRGEAVKAARSVRVGDPLDIERGNERYQVVIAALAQSRGPAVVAQQLYQETTESQQRRAESPTLRDPAAAVKGRPSKRDARELQRIRGLRNG
jgi:ribosome-associated heat shock protein Hsp15